MASREVGELILDILVGVNMHRVVGIEHPPTRRTTELFTELMDRLGSFSGVPTDEDPGSCP